MRKLASVVAIATAEPIPDTDGLDVVTMEGKGWRVVTSRGEFSPGDRAVYFEIDSALPADDDRYAFLHARCLKAWRDKHGKVLAQAVRIRTIRLRGVISQGLVMPIDRFPELSGASLGDDVTETLRVGHYDELSEQMAAILDTRMRPGTGRRQGAFPSCVPKTDEERIQNLADWPDTLKGVLWEVTEKADGSSATYVWSPSNYPETPFMVCSRNFRLSRDEGSAWWAMADRYGIEDKMRALGRELAIQGELVGPGVNGNRDLRSEYDLLVFRIWDIDGQCYLPTDERVRLCEELGLKHVKVISPAMDVFTELPTVDDVLRFAEGVTDRGNEREGLVFKEVGTTHPRSFKAVSNRYLLKIR